MTTSVTPAQASALQWLKDRGGTGVWDRERVMLASGERAAVMHTTWTSLVRDGLLSRDGKRFTVTAAGQNMPAVEPSRTIDEDEDVGD